MGHVLLIVSFYALLLLLLAVVGIRGQEATNADLVLLNKNKKMKKKIGRCKNTCYAEKDDCKERKKCMKFQTKLERTKCKSSCTDDAFRCKYKCYNEAVGCGAGDCHIKCTAGVERCIMNSFERNRRKKRSLLGNDDENSQELKVIRCHKTKKNNVNACFNECCYNNMNIEGERRLVVQQQKQIQTTTSVPLPEVETENVEGCGDCPCCPDPDDTTSSGLLSFIQAHRQGENSYYCLTYENGWVVGENPSITKTQYEACTEYIIMKQKNNHQVDNSFPGPEGTLWQQWD